MVVLLTIIVFYIYFVLVLFTICVKKYNKCTGQTNIMINKTDIKAFLTEQYELKKSFLIKLFLSI